MAPSRALPLLIVVLAACKPSPVAKIQVERDVLVSDDEPKIRETIAGFPECTDLPPKVLQPNEKGPYDDGCLAAIATGFGSKKGFSGNAPDHASSAAVALVLLRDGRGDWMTGADTWLGVVKSGKGLGPDVVRLAIARKMAAAAPLVGRAFAIEEEPAAAKALRAIDGAIPGACPTYWLLGANGGDAGLAPELSADHSACVYEDLKRREGPGGKYGSGIFRALQGAVALWRDAERGIRMGLPDADPAAKATLEKKLVVIEAASKAIVLPEQASSRTTMFTEHADAGVPPSR